MSYDQSDITFFNNADGVSKSPNRGGWKKGRGRCTFTATSGVAVGATTLGLLLPKGTTVSRCVYKVLTNFESATDASTIALSLVAANDIVTATALSVGTTWDAGIPVVCVPVTATLSTWLHTTVDSSMTATVGIEALASGKLVLFAEWFYWGDLALT